MMAHPWPPHAAPGVAEFHETEEATSVGAVVTESSPWWT
jgi:hypothetical protein